MNLLAFKATELDLMLTGQINLYDAYIDYKGINKKKCLKNIDGIQREYAGKAIKTNLFSNNVRIEIREKENGHNIPHFHVSIKGGGDASYEIETCKKIIGNIDSKKEKKILEWAAKNKKMLADTWNLYHSIGVTVS